MKSDTIKNDENQGYKQTDIGLIPDDWKVILLKEISNIKYGKATPKTSGSIPVIGSGGIFKYTDKYLIDYPSIVIGRKGTAGKSWLIKEPCYPSDTAFFLEWKEEVNVDFIYFFMILNPLSGDYAKTTLPSIQKPDLENCKLPYPPLPEQKAIAHILSTIQEAKEKTEAVIQAAKELKKSMMKYLFTYGAVPVNEADKVKLKETEIGMMPEDWEVAKIGKAVIFLNGFSFKSSDFIPNSNTQLIRMGNLYQNTFDLSRNPIFLPDSFIEKYKDYKLSKGDLILSLTGTTGKEDYGFTVKIPTLTSPALLLNQRIVKIFPISVDYISKDYLYYFLLSRKFLDTLYKTAKGTKQANLSINTIKSLNIILPKLQNQIHIAKILVSIDDKIESEKSKLLSLDMLFKSMLHNLMTGKIRLGNK